MVKKRKTKKINWAQSYVSLILGVIVVLAAFFLLITFKGNKNITNNQMDKINTAASTSIGINNEEVSSQKETKTYFVKTGDNLWDVAEKIYGSGYNWVDLAKENNLDNPGILIAGTKLEIPDVEPKIITISTQSNVNISSPQSIIGETYIVQKGDYLWDVAVRAYGDGYKWPEIAKANNLDNPDLIFSGNTLKIPR